MYSKTTWKLNAAIRVIAVCGLLLPALVRCATYASGPTYGGGSLQFSTATGYVNTYDHLDVNRLLKNDKLVSAFVRCFLNEGPCTVEGKLVKTYLLPEVIRTVCGKCSPRQKEMARQVLTHVYKNRRSEFERIMKIYDTEGKYNSIIAFMNQKN